MCGRYTLTLRPGDLQTRFGVPLPGAQGTGRYNIAPTESVLAVTAGAGAGDPPRAQLLRWGLVPHWADDLRVGARMINARVETVLERPAFRALVGDGDRRALVLADGWYEWLRGEDPRLRGAPLRFTFDGGAPFAFAGLWAKSRVGGETVRSVTILTTSSAGHPVLAPVHDRMPVVLAGPEEERAWLEPGLDGPAALELCRALPAGRVRTAAVNPAVGRAGPDNDGPHLLIVPDSVPDPTGVLF